MAIGAFTVDAVVTQNIRTYESNLIHLVQQKGSKLRATVTEKDVGSANHSFRVTAQRVGALNDKANQGLNTGKRQVTVYEDQKYNDRVAIPSAKYTADSYEWDDLTKMLTDPQSTLIKAQSMQMARGIDDVIIAAFHASATDTGGNATTFVADGGAGATFDAGQGGTQYQFRLDDVLLLNEKYLSLDVDPDEEKYLVVNPRAITKMLATQQVTSSDYQSLKALIGNGTLDNFMGFNWIVSNRLTIGGGAGRKYCISYTKDALGLLVTKDINVKVGEEPGKQFAVTVMSAMELGAVRVQGNKCFRIDTSDTL